MERINEIITLLKSDEKLNDLTSFTNRSCENYIRYMIYDSVIKKYDKNFDKHFITKETYNNSNIKIYIPKNMITIIPISINGTEPDTVIALYYCAATDIFYDKNNEKIMLEKIKIFGDGRYRIQFDIKKLILDFIWKETENSYTKNLLIDPFPEDDNKFNTIYVFLMNNGR